MSTNAAINRRSFDEPDDEPKGRQKNMQQDEQNERSEFRADVLNGLSHPSKSLPCKWFYDAVGSELFEQITLTPEYYLTRIETDLLQKVTSGLAGHVANLSVIVEPGSGSSNKTRILLRSQPQLQEYIPIDISADFLYESTARLKKEFPHLKISPQVQDFTTLAAPLRRDKTGTCLVFFPGSTIGNFNVGEAKNLLNNIGVMAGKNCWLLIGVDMTQNPASLLAAYNDASGVTARFNKNLLSRINRELDANFDLAKFEHRAIFNIEQHRIEMHLVSTVAHAVKVAGQIFSFAANEFIHTENSYKYPKDKFESLLQDAGWLTHQVWEDNETSGFGIFLLKSSH
jgi:L-histidine Nalpha-methyltransferase